MKAALSIAGLLVLSTSWLAAQDLQAVPQTIAGSERVDGKLFELVRPIPHAQRSQLTSALRESLRARAKALRMKVRADDKVFVEIVGPAQGRLERDVSLPALTALGIEIGSASAPRSPRVGETVGVPLSRTAQRAEAWLPLAAIERLEALLPKGWRVRPVPPIELDQTAVVGEGPTRINSITYRTGGANGAGLVIAVIDSDFSGLTAARANGDAPAAAQMDLTVDAGNPANFENGTTAHGTDCLQNVFDHAPGAVYRLYRIDGSNDYQNVIDDCLAAGVDIISHSISQYNEGWGDDSGPTCQQANRAAQNDILFFTSCGNRANSHYEGAFTDTDGDNIHEFAPGDESIDVTVAANGGGSHYLSWSNAASDFDFFLFDNAGNLLMASANAGAGAFETFAFNPATATNCRLAVSRRGGPANSTLEIFSHNAATWNEYAVAAGSSTSPSNATQPNVISVGAVTQGSYGSAMGSNVIANYSSRGPSHGGLTLPDLCGPTDTLVFPAGTFGGTSCATPNVAGAAAAFWSADFTLSADGIRWLLTTQAGLYRDWGGAGVDGVYGAGGARLVDFRAGTRWVARDYPGTVDDGSVPFHTTQAAYVFVPPGGRLLFFGTNFGSFPEPAELGPLNKTVTLEVVPNTGFAQVGP